MPKSKLGVHIENVVDRAGMHEWFDIARPAIAKIIDDDPEFVKGHPDTFWVGRAYTEDQHWGKPDDHFRRIMRKAMAHDVDCWEGHNEPPAGDLEKVARFDIRMAELLHAEDICYVAGSWSVGVPDIPQWRNPAMLDCLRVVDYLGLHEYCAPTMWDLRAFDPQYTNRESYITGGWFTLRYRKVRDVLNVYLGQTPPPIIISECGIDSGAAHWDPGAQGGWKSFTDVEGYMEQLAWYDRQLQKDPFIVGATIFTFGTRSQDEWATFDCWEHREMRDALAEYIKQAPAPPPSNLEARVAELEEGYEELCEQLTAVWERIIGAGEILSAD